MHSRNFVGSRVTKAVAGIKDAGIVRSRGLDSL